MSDQSEAVPPNKLRKIELNGVATAADTHSPATAATLANVTDADVQASDIGRPELTDEFECWSNECFKIKMGRFSLCNVAVYEKRAFFV